MKINIIVLAIAMLFSVQSSPQAETNQLRFGAVALDTPMAMHKRLEPLMSYLSEKIGMPVTLKRAVNMKSAITELIQGKVELAYLTPVAYVHSHRKGKARILAKIVTDNQPSFQLKIFVRKDSPIKTVDDLVGKRFAFGYKESLLQRATLIGAGIPLEKLSGYDFLEQPQNIIRSVLYSDYDAGIVKDTKAYKWKDKGIRVIYASPQLPPFNITVASHVDENIYHKLQDALLSLDENNPKDRKVIHSLDRRYNGFVAAKDKEYDIVRKLIKPFQ